MRQVRCTTDGCENAGVVREITDHQVAPGVVQRAPLYCVSCDAELWAPQPKHRSRERAVKTAPETRSSGS